jgi:hypothetical protein
MVRTQTLVELLIERIDQATKNPGPCGTRAESTLANLLISSRKGLISAPPYAGNCSEGGHQMIRLVGIFVVAMFLSSGWASGASIDNAQLVQQQVVEQKPGCFNRCAAKQICRRCNGHGRCCTNCCR